MHADYMRRAFDSIDDMWAKMEKRVAHVEYDTMVGIGLSGTLVVPTLARQAGKYWAIVRKEDNSHSTNRFEGEIGRTWLFVDDFINTGHTLKTVQGIIEDIFADYYGYSTKYVGTYLYQWDRYSK